MDNNTQPLGHLIERLLKAYGLEQRMDQVSIGHEWEQIVGPMVAKHTKNARLKDGTLFIELDSAPLRHTMNFSKSELCERLNKHLGKEVINEIVIR